MPWKRVAGSGRSVAPRVGRSPATVRHASKNHRHGAKDAKDAPTRDLVGALGASLLEDTFQVGGDDRTLAARPPSGDPIPVLGASWRPWRLGGQLFRTNRAAAAPLHAPRGPHPGRWLRPSATDRLTRGDPIAFLGAPWRPWPWRSTLPDESRRRPVVSRHRLRGRPRRQGGAASSAGRSGTGRAGARRRSGCPWRGTSRRRCTPARSRRAPA